MNFRAIVITSLALYYAPYATLILVVMCMAAALYYFAAKDAISAHIEGLPVGTRLRAHDACNGCDRWYVGKIVSYFVLHLLHTEGRLRYHSDSQSYAYWRACSST